MEGTESSAVNTMRRKSSKVWKHFIISASKKTVNCMLCKSKLSWHGSTTVMHEHLKRKHVGVTDGKASAGYQRRKQEGKTKNLPVAELSKVKQEEIRQKWRQYQKSHRKKIQYLPLQSCSQDGMNFEWLQEFAPYSPSSEAEEGEEVPISSFGLVKQEPDSVEIQWVNMNSPPPVASNSEQNNAAISSTVIPPITENRPSNVVLTMTKLHCMLESKQEKIEALEKQVQDLQEDRRFLRSQIESLTRALSIHVSRGISDETTAKS